MSPSWRESLQLELGAHDLRLRRLARGWRPQVLFEQRQALAGLSAEAAAQALDAAWRALPAPPLAKSIPTTLVLSSDWVHFALQDQAGALHGTAERQAAAGHALRRVYGDAALRWKVGSCDAGAGMLLAAGVDAALNDTLARALQVFGARLVSAQPALVLAVNRCRHWLRKPSWLVSLEPGLATIAFSDGECLRTLRHHRLRHSLREELPVWIEQARLIDGLGEPGAELTIACCAAEVEQAAALTLASRVVAVDRPAAAHTP